MLTQSVLAFSFWDFTLGSVIALLVLFFFIGMVTSKPGEKYHDSKMSKAIEIKEAEKQKEEWAARSLILEKDPDDDDFENSELVRRLIALDDARLTEIIENPLFYKEKCIRKARSILGRRHAWENIKNLTDSELIKMITTEKHLCDESMRGAASMELYQRDSQLLYMEIQKMSRATIRSIDNGSLKVPEGIRLAARKYLSHKK